MRLCEFTAFLEIGSGSQSNKHIFVQIGGQTSTYPDPPLEDIDIRQISDKFPQNKEGLKELYDKGPQDAFFLVKFWVSALKFFLFSFCVKSNQINSTQLKY